MSDSNDDETESIREKLRRYGLDIRVQPFVGQPMAHPNDVIATVDVRTNGTRQGIEIARVTTPGGIDLYSMVGEDALERAARGAIERAFGDGDDDAADDDSST